MINRIDAFQALLEYIKQYGHELDFKNEVSQIEGAIKCLNAEKNTIAICGKSNSCLDKLIQVLFGFDKEGEYFKANNSIVAFSYSDKNLERTVELDCGESALLNVMPNNLLSNKNIVFVLLNEGNEKIMFNNVLSACDKIILDINLDSAIGKSDREICWLVNKQWNQPERVSALFIDTNENSIPSVMAESISDALGADGKILYEVIDDFEDKQTVFAKIASLLSNIDADGKSTVLKRTFYSIKNVQQKLEAEIEKLDERQNVLNDELNKFNVLVAAFEAQYPLHIPSAEHILDDNLKQDISSDAVEFISFIQSKIDNELKSATKDEIEAFLPFYYAYLINEFVNQVSSERMLPLAQEKFNDIMKKIMKNYTDLFGENIPSELTEYTHLAGKNFLSIIDRTQTQAADVKMGVIEATIFYLITDSNPIAWLFYEEILTVVYRLKKGMYSIYKRYIQSKDSFDKEAGERIKALLDESLNDIVEKIKDSVYPSLQKSVRDSLQIFVCEACKPLREKQEAYVNEIEEIKHKIEINKNIANNYMGLISKCE